MTDRVPGAPGRCKAVVTAEELQKMQSGNEFAITLRRDDHPIQEGTPYSKAAVLPDAVAAKLCPGVQDPTPGDAFGALYDQKADTVRHASGSNITLHDAAYTPLMGLKIYGEDTENRTVGESGSVTVKVMGKNIANVQKFSTDSRIPTPTAATPLSNSYGTTISANTGNSVTVEQSTASGDVNSYTNGFFSVGFYCSLKAGDKVTMSYNYQVTTNPLNNSGMRLILNGQLITVAYRQNVDPGLYYHSFTVTSAMEKADNWNYLEIRIGGKSGVFSNFQIEYGSAYTGFEEYKEPQTLTVSTPGGLPGGDIRDEIDFARGVLIRRVSENKEYPLPDDVLEAYAKLHTFTPTTVITNDYGAEMEVVYYTDTTAVQMVHSPADKGKTFTIDEHGCVTLVKDNPEIVSGETTIDEVKWYYRKWNNGYAEFWSSVVPLGYEGSRILSRWTALPFPVWEKVISMTVPEAESSYLLQEPYVLSYLEIDGGNTVKICAIRDAGGFTEADHINVSVHITGLWKAD